MVGDLLVRALLFYFGSILRLDPGCCGVVVLVWAFITGRPRECRSGLGMV